MVLKSRAAGRNKPKQEPPKTTRSPTFAELLAAERLGAQSLAAPRRPPASPAVTKSSAKRRAVNPLVEAEPLAVSSNGERCEASAPGTPASVLRELKQGKNSPQVTLDVHGLTAAQAVHAVDALLQSALDSDLRTLLIVHGRGLHSGPDGPVLQGAIVEYLSRVRAAAILALCSAPAKWGGAGALLVRVRRQY